MCLQSISCFFQRKVQWQAMHFGTAHSSIPVRKKIAFALPCHCPAFQPLKAFFSFPPYRCLSLRSSSVTHRKSHRFPMFLQPIAGIPFSDINRRFIPAVYALPSPRTAVWCCPVPAQHHTAVFPIPFPQRVPRNPYLSINTLLDFESPKIAYFAYFANFATFTISQDDFPGNI